MELFLIYNQNYDYDQLCDEIGLVQKQKKESVDEIISRITQIYYRFHDDDRPSQEDFLELYTYLISISLSGEDIFGI
jgi:xylose isomerase